MLSFKTAKLARMVSSAAIIGMALAGAVPGQAYGQAELDLELGGSGSIPWNIGNIQPGDSGTEMVELHNAGSGSGDVVIWVDNITGSDYAGDGAALDNYLFLDVDCARATTNFALPARITELPQSAADARQLTIDSLQAGETVTLVWEWEFRETGLPQNDAQGDSLSFNINYMLTDQPVAPPTTLPTTLPTPSGSAGSVPILPRYNRLYIDLMGKTTFAYISTLGVMRDSYTATDPAGENALQLDAGIRVTCIDGDVPVKIQMMAGDNSPPAPDGFELITPIYELTGDTYFSDQIPVKFSPLAQLTLAYDNSQLSADNATVKIGCYDATTGWSVLETSDDYAPGRVSANMRQGTFFAVLASVAVPPPTTSTTVTVSTTTPPREPQPIENLPPPVDLSPPEMPSTTASPVTVPPAPAQFDISELDIKPDQAKPGEPVSVSVRLQNTGGQEDKYSLDLVVNGAAEQTVTTTLAGGDSTHVVFTLVRDEPGTYTIEVGNLSGKLTVTAAHITTFRSDILLWSVALTVPTAGLLTYLFAIKFKVFT